MAPRARKPPARFDPGAASKSRAAPRPRGGGQGSARAQAKRARAPRRRQPGRARARPRRVAGRAQGLCARTGLQRWGGGAAAGGPARPSADQGAQNGGLKPGWKWASLPGAGRGGGWAAGWGAVPHSNRSTPVPSTPLPAPRPLPASRPPPPAPRPPPPAPAPGATTRKPPACYGPGGAGERGVGRKNPHRARSRPGPHHKKTGPGRQGWVCVWERA
jgi:hypothetical protein